MYGRGTVDDKDNLTAALMTMLLLKRLNVPLDRDVIFLAESGEEGSTGFGIQFMVAQHYPGDRGRVLPRGGRRRDADRRRGRSSRPSRRWRRFRAASSWWRAASPATDRCRSSRTRLSTWPARWRAVGEWRPDIRFNETTGTYFRRLAAISPPEVAKAYRDVLVGGSEGARRRRRLAVRARAAALVDAAHVGVAEHLHRRLPLERDSVGSEGDARRARAARRGSGEVPRAGEDRS